MSRAPYGMTQEQYDAFLDACTGCGVKPRITQMIGTAKASAGTHEADGPGYCAATDFSVRGLSEQQIRAFVAAMWLRGWVPFYRKCGFDGWPSRKGYSDHIHAVYTGVRMKRALRDQVHDALAGRSGLASHGGYRFYQPDEQRKAVVRELFLAHNQTNG